MCQECGNNNSEDMEFSQWINEMPAEEREDFTTFACQQFETVINRAADRGILLDLITTWSKERQAEFTFACVMSNRADAIAEALDDYSSDEE